MVQLRDKGGGHESGEGNAPTEGLGCPDSPCRDDIGIPVSKNWPNDPVIPQE